MTSASEQRSTGRLFATFGPALIALALGALVFAGLDWARQSRRGISHAQSVIESLHHVILRVVDAETGVRGHFITGDSAYLKPYVHAREDVAAGMTRLRDLTADSPVQRHRLDTLALLLAARFAILDTGAARTISTNPPSGPPVSRRGTTTMDEIRRVIGDMEHEEARLLDERSAVEAARSRIVMILVIIGSIVAAVLALLTNGILTRSATAQTRMTEELTRTNSTLRAQTGELTEANQAKMLFLSAMSHELRTPLNAIDGYAELLALGVRGPITDAQAGDIARIRQNAGFLTAVINDILLFAKLEAGHADLNLVPVPIRDVLAGIESLIGPLADAKGVLYRYLPDDGTLVAHADRDRLQQVVLNLVTNGIKFTPRGGSVTVSSRVEGAWVCIVVADTGRGIPAEKLHKIFDAFMQIDRRLTTPSLQGAGLGLAISRDLVTKMGGEIAVESEVDTGSTFTIKLPSFSRPERE